MRSCLPHSVVLPNGGCGTGTSKAKGMRRSRKQLSYSCSRPTNQHKGTCAQASPTICPSSPPPYSLPHTHQCRYYSTTCAALCVASYPYLLPSCPPLPRYLETSDDTNANMAVFVDLDDDDVDPPPQPGLFKPIWNGDIGHNATTTTAATEDKDTSRKEAHEIAVRENLNQNSTTEALGCYP